MSDLSTADQLRWLADVIDAVGDQGIDVHDAEPLGADGDGDRLVAEVVLSAPRPDVLEDADVEVTNEITEADLESIAFVDEDEPDWETAEDLEDDQEFPELEDLDWEPVDPESPELADEPVGPEPAPEDDDREESLDEDEQDEVQEDVDSLSPGERAVVDALEDAGEELLSSEIIDRVDGYATGSIQGYLSTLKNTPHVEYRDDPDHRNRLLYRAAGVSIDDDAGDEDRDDEIVDEDDSPEPDGDTDEDDTDEDPFTAAAERRRNQADSTESDTTESASEADDPTTALAEDGDTDAKQSDQEATDEVLEASGRPDWLARDADEIVADVGTLRRSLGEVLDVAESAETMIDVNLRLGCELVTAKDVMWELGLRAQSPDTKLIEEPERSERIETLREIYVDGEEVTA